MRHGRGTPEQIRTEAGDRLEQRQVLTESFETVKLKNIIPRFASNRSGEDPR